MNPDWRNSGNAATLHRGYYAGPAPSCSLADQMARSCPDVNYGGNFWAEGARGAKVAGEAAYTALTSDCAQAAAGGAALVGIGTASIFSGVAFIQAGGLVGGSAAAAGASAAAGGAVIVGPGGADTVLLGADLAGHTYRSFVRCAD